MSITTILSDQARYIEDDQRAIFLEQLFGPRWRQGEQNAKMLFNLFTPRALTAHFRCVETESKARALVAPGADLVTIEVLTNGYRGQMSGEAAGIIITSLALVMLMEQDPDDNAPFESHDRLMEWAKSHPDARLIDRALD